MAAHRTVLLVESDPALLEGLDVALRRRGYHVLTAADGERAAELALRHLPNAAAVGMLLARQSGFQVARLVKERSDGAVPVVMYADGTAGFHRDYALALGVDSFLERSAADEVAAAVAGLCPVPAALRAGGSASRPAAR